MYKIAVYCHNINHNKVIDALTKQGIKMKFDAFVGGMRYISEKSLSFRDSQKIRDSFSQELRDAIKVYQSVHCSQLGI
jgi:hypothetical protein